jgi:hypothetical protein
MDSPPANEGGASFHFVGGDCPNLSPLLAAKPPAGETINNRSAISSGSAPFVNSSLMMRVCDQPVMLGGVAQSVASS